MWGPSMEDKKIISAKMIQFDLLSYTSFYDHDWSRATFDAVHGSPLEDAVNSLCVLWKSAANTHHLPALTARLLAATSEGYLNGLNPYNADFFTRFADALVQRMGKDLSHMKGKAIRQQISEMGRAFTFNIPEAEFSIEAWWNRLNIHGEFHLTMFGAISLCFCALLFGYESFVVDCYTLLGLDVRHRISRREFWSELEKVVPHAKAAYWSDDYITMARETRNCIAHRGNKAKPELLEAIKRVPAGQLRIHVQPDGEISIMAGDNHLLFGALKSKVTALIEEVLPKL